MDKVPTQMEELIDVLDGNGNKTGEIKPKSTVKKEGDFHKAISVCIINEQKEILMQKRSGKKKAYPNLWSIFVKGHVIAGETSLDACKREVFEELGISIEINELQYLYTIKEETKVNEEYIENIFFDTFLLIKNIEIEKIKMQSEEVEDVKWMFYKKVEKLITERGDMVPNQKDYEKIFQFIK